MTPTDVEKTRLIVAKISQQILSYESGDLIALSDLIKSAEQLLSSVSSHEHLSSTARAAAAVCTAEMMNDTPDFTKKVSQGVDIITDMLDSPADVPEWKIQRASAWISSVFPQNGTAETAQVLNVHTTAGSSEISADPPPEPHTSDDAVFDREQLQLFVSDASTRLSRAQELILLLEDDIKNMELIKELFRLFHTIKGECGFLKLSSLGFLTHNIENLLDLLRSSKIEADGRVIDFLLNGLDLSKKLLDEISEGSVLVKNKMPLDSYITSLSLYTSEIRPPVGAMLAEKGLISEKQQHEIFREQLNSNFEKRYGQIAIENQYITEDNLMSTLQEQQQAELLAVKAAHDSQYTHDSVHENVPTQNHLSDTKQAAVKHDRNDTIIKVRTSKVNFLVDMIGELLISLGQIQHEVPGLAEVRKISRTLQHSSMQLRTESVRILFITVKRIIRDVSAKLGKTVHAEFTGDDLEIDRQLIESLEEPLMHLVRNSLDHGIESPEERIAAGKDPQGTIKIKAERRGNNIVLSVGDDGKGLDRKKILEKAVAKNIIRSEDASSMTDAAVYNIIFLPGFSTKAQADFVSGRGVGMDIIKQAVTKAKGHIETISTPGKGTVFELFFPLSTAIIDGMTVRTGSSCFIIPITVIIESIKIKPEFVTSVQENVRVLNVRGQILPLISLASVFEIPDAGSSQIATIVETTSRQRFAVVSDEIISKNEVVIKSLGPRFRDFKGVSSGTVLAGGAIGLVLDIDQFYLMGTARVKSAVPSSNKPE